MGIQVLQPGDKPTTQYVEITAEVSFSGNNMKPSTTKAEVMQCVSTAGFLFNVGKQKFPVHVDIIDYDKKHREFRCYITATLKFCGVVPFGTVTVKNFEKAIKIGYTENEYDTFSTPWNNKKDKPIFSVSEVRVQEIYF